MAYVETNAPRIISQPIAGNALWLYETTDNISDMLTSGYITNADSLGMTVADVVFAVNSTTGTSSQFFVTSITSGAATLKGGDYNNMVVVKSVDDFPDPVNSVITLPDNTAYMIDGSVNIGENRIVCGINSAIYGYSPEVCYLHNTLASQAMITSDETISLYRISLYVSGSGASILDLDASTSSQSNNAIDWQFVNFSGGDVGTIKDYDNAIFNTLGYIDKSADGFPALGDGLTFDGTIGTVSFTDTIFVVDGSGNTALTIPATATLTRRLRLTDCAVVATNSAVGLNVSASATIPDEGYVLNNVNFSGNGTLLSGLDYTSDIARFEGCRGITNTYAAAYITMNGNATATTISATGTPVKAAGTTTGSSVSQKFDVSTTSNRAVYTGSLTRLSAVTAIVSLTAGNGHQVGVYIAKNGTVIDESETYLTTNASGRLENGSVQTITLCASGDYFEVFVENNTATANITVEDLSLVVIDI